MYVRPWSSRAAMAWRNKRLLAYVTGCNSSAPGAQSLRDHLKRRLPEFMIPTTFEVLADIPLTANGKVDRKVLLAPESTQIRRETGSPPPRDSTEDALVRIWEKALGIAPVGIDENFFELGGHSLLAMRVFAEIRRELRVESLQAAAECVHAPVVVADNFVVMNTSSRSRPLSSTPSELRLRCDTRRRCPPSESRS
jgi:Phosphopantetheine attachment site/AMP-binding enzyme C-terminal domain